VKAVKAKGIRLGHTPNVLNDAVADITVMLVLMTMRRVQAVQELAFGVLAVDIHYLVA
jgi:lactate dehydrogenase-like 2-hydroxyacid dehydrogenase